MRGKTLQEFFETLSWGEEMEFSYKGEDYFIQGINHESNKKEIQLVRCNIPGPVVYSHIAKTFEDCVLALQEAQLIEGKTIYEMESEIIVTYG